MQVNRTFPWRGAEGVASPAELGAGDEPRLSGPDRGGHARPAGGRHRAVAGAAGLADRRRFRLEGDQADDAAAVRAAVAADLSGGVWWALGTSHAPTGRGRAGRVARPGPGRTIRAPTAGGRRRGGAAGCWSCWACGGRGTKDAPSGRAATPAGSAAQGSEHPSVSPPFPLPYPRRAPDGGGNASTAHSRRSKVPSPGVGRKKRGRPPGSRWCGPSRWVLLRRPAGEEKPAANPTRPAIHGRAVRVYGEALGSDPDRSAARPSAASDAPAGVAA
jgi:hypothetical protein